MEKVALKLIDTQPIRPQKSPSSDEVCSYNACGGTGWVEIVKNGDTFNRICECKRDIGRLKLLGDRFYKVTLLGTQPRTPQQEKLKNVLLSNPGLPVFIYGPGDTGKTHFLAATFNHWDLLHKKVKYFEDGTLKDALREAELSSDTRFFYDVVNEHDYIFIDDVNKSTMTDFHRGALYRLFNEVYKRRKHIFITSNDSLATLGSERYWGPHVTRRVEETCELVEF